MTRMFQPTEIEHSRPRDGFDPIREGARHGLSPELSLAIWRRVSEDAAGFGRSTREQLQQQFR